LRGRQDSLAETLAGYLREAHKLAVDLRVWTDKPLPDHLRVRVQVVDERGQPLAPAAIWPTCNAGWRSASGSSVRKSPGRTLPAWRRARARWEREGQTEWTFGEIPERVHVCDQAGVPVYAYPALVPVDAGGGAAPVRTPEEAQAALRRGLFQLFELQLRYELAWLQRDLRDLRALGVLAAAFLTVEALQEQAYAALRRWACARPVAPLTGEAFARELERIRTDLRGVVPRLVDLVREILTFRQEVLIHPQTYPGLVEDLAALLPTDFIATTPFMQLAHFPRYLKAMSLRAERWKQHPARDAQRAKQVAPYLKAAAALPPEAILAGAADRFRWLVEEYRVSLFAQELGTAEPVSPVKLDRELQTLRRAAAKAGAPVDAHPGAESRMPAPAPVAVRVATGPLKNLGALDRLFPRA
jgi:ATP-dependent helicase HrpA